MNVPMNALPQLKNQHSKVTPLSRPFGVPSPFHVMADQPRQDLSLAPCVPTRHCRKVHETMENRDVVDVKRPSLVWPRDLHVPQQVCHHLGAVSLTRQVRFRVDCMNAHLHHIASHISPACPVPVVPMLGADLPSTPHAGFSVWILSMSSLAKSSAVDGGVSLWYAAERDTRSSESTHLTDNPQRSVLLE